MSLLLPVMTFILVAVGAFCLFIAMEHDRRTRRKSPARAAATQDAAHMGQRRMNHI